ncbi:GTP-binding protein [Celerinatantimonas sp. YJH-8]|uniref:GTP-binding protein n=1 Tax=Celerinatantimonas sp. YJH-8 TaxID=3228714 RepID=UPI0038C30238
MSKENAERSKPSVIVGSMGHAGHGKTTLIAAMTTVLAKNYGDATQGAAVKQVEYDTDIRHYVHLDCVGHTDDVTSMITDVARMDVAILVVDSVEGPMAQTREYLSLARQVDVPYLIVFINKCDMVDEERIERVEVEVRKLLSEYDFSNDDIPVIKGSALGALQGEVKWEEGIIKLAHSLDDLMPASIPAEYQPFLMPIDEVVAIPGRGTVVTGLIQTGIVKVNEEIEVVGVGIIGRRTALCLGIEMSRKLMNEGRAGECVGILLGGLNGDEVERGQVLAKPVVLPSFIMPIKETFAIPGRGMVVTGLIERGIVKINEEIEVVGIKERKKAICLGIEMSHKVLNEGRAGESVGILLGGINSDEVEHVQVLIKPSKITPHPKTKE